MINESIIKSKYKEYYEKNNRRNIDDYENYVMSRTIEYFYNTEQFSMDKLVDLITSSIKKNDLGTQYESEPNKEFDSMRTDDVKDGPKSRAERMCCRRYDKKLWPVVLICVIIIGGYIGYLLGRKQ